METLTKKDLQNRGYLFHRTEFKNPIFPEHLNREKVFAENWIEENKIIRGLNWGHGILQDLFILSDEKWLLYPGRIVVKINPRDRFIVATIIQWLGTNVGFSFLVKCLNQCGYDVVRRKF